MPKYPTLKPSDVIRALRRIGFVEIRCKGSHKQLKKGNLLVTVPFHNKDLKQETLKSILRQARLTIDEILIIVKI